MNKRLVDYYNDRSRFDPLEDIGQLNTNTGKPVTPYEKPTY